MRKNIIQTGERRAGKQTYIENDWFNGSLPANVIVEPNVYIDTSYGFTAFHSEMKKGLYLSEGTGCYDRSTFITGEQAEITVGEFTILNSTTLVCNKSISIGSHCMLAWGSVVTDTWLNTNDELSARQEMLINASKNATRMMPVFAKPSPVVLEDHCWIGFDSVILPGARIGKGAIVGSKVVIYTDVPPYAVVVGNPARIIRYLHPDDTQEAKEEAFRIHLA